MKILVCFVAVAISTCTAVLLDGWVDVGSSDKTYFIGSKEVTWEVALATCLKKGPGVRLATFSTPLETDLVREHLKSSKYILWIGVFKNESGHFARVLAPHSNYYNWRVNEPNDVGIEECVEVRADEELTWNDLSCNKNRKFICEADKAIQPVCGHEYQDWKYFNGYCYSARATREAAQDWQSAEESCVQKNSHLVSVHNLKEFSFLVDELNTTSDSLHQMWMGLKYKDGSRYTWTDGSSVQFDQLQTSPQHKEGCLSLDVRDTAEHWNVGICTRRLGFVCKIPYDLTKTSQRSTPECSTPERSTPESSSPDSSTPTSKPEMAGVVYISVLQGRSGGGETAGLVINILLTVSILSVLLFFIVRLRRACSGISFPNKSFDTKWSVLNEENRPSLQEDP